MRFLVGLLALPLMAAVDDVRVFGVTATQAVIAYTAPNANACTLEVSEESDYSPVVNDLNTSLFSGSNSDSRAGNVSIARHRSFVVGKKIAEVASDDKRHSRALQTNTQHYFRITCGGDQAAGVFVTRNIQFGNTRAEATPVLAGGVFGQPSMITDRSLRSTATQIDPTTGVLVRPASHMPRDINEDFSGAMTSVALGTNWTDAGNILADDANSATYSGTTQDWLLAKLAITPWDGMQPDYFRFYLKANSSAGAGDNDTVQMCLTLDASTCASDMKEVLLGTTPNTQHCWPNGGTPTSCSNTITPIEMWVDLPGRPLNREQIAENSNFGVLIRKKGTGSGTITIQYVSYYMGLSKIYVGFDTGGFKSCQDIEKADSSGNVGYFCYARTYATAGHLIWVDRDTHEVRFLGQIRPNGTGYYFYDSSTWDSTIAGLLYASLSNTLYKGLYTGSVDASVAVNTTASFTWTSLVTNIETLLQTYTADPYDGPQYVPANFDGGVAAAANGNVIFRMRRGPYQDCLVWHAVYDVGDGLPEGECTGCGIVAAVPSWNRPASRWCGEHAFETDGSMDTWEFIPQGLVFGSVGRGPYQSELTGCSGTGCSGDNMTSCTEPCQTTVTVTSSHSTPGEPYCEYADNELQSALAGDIFSIDSETVRIATKNSPTSWLVDRGWGISTPGAHTASTNFTAQCYAGSWETASSGFVFWNYLLSSDGGNPAYYKRGTADALAGAHHSYYGNWRLTSGWFSCTGTLSEVPGCDNGYYSQFPSPLFAGKYVTADGNNWQKHATSMQQSKASPSEQNWGLDALPMHLATGLWLSNWTAVTGDLWRGTNTGMNRRHIETLAACGGSRGIVDISGPGSSIGTTSADNYKYCVALVNGECYGGSTAGQVYVNCPNLTTESTCSGQPGLANESVVCIGDWPAYAHSNVQIRLDKSSATGQAVRVLHRSFSPTTEWNIYATIMPTPGQSQTDGSLGALTQEKYWERRTSLSMKIPPQPPADSINRSTFIPVPVQLAPPSALGVNNAIVEFGFDANFYCTSRSESCIANGSTVNETTPFTWPTEAGGESSITGVSCASGCTVTVPAFSGKILYYRWKYRNVSNVVLATSSTQVVAVP